LWGGSFVLKTSRDPAATWPNRFGRLANQNPKLWEATEVEPKAGTKNGTRSRRSVGHWTGLLRRRVFDATIYCNIHMSLNPTIRVDAALELERFLKNATSDCHNVTVERPNCSAPNGSGEIYSAHTACAIGEHRQDRRI
jgi:hypothetical protein